MSGLGTMKKSDRRAMTDALRDMKRGGARPIDLRQLPVRVEAFARALYGARK